MTNHDSIEAFIQTHARPLDQAFYAFRSGTGSAEAVLDALAQYQNKDGGFGNAIEPDLRLPQSTALSTWMAFQYIKEVTRENSHPVVRRALNYLVDAFDAERLSWPIILPEVDEHPHAPWWNYKSAMEHFDWANPSAELLGLLIAYNVQAPEMIEPALEQARTELPKLDPEDFHSVFCAKAFVQLIPESLSGSLTAVVEDLVLRAVSLNPDDWNGYVATPLKFLSGPTDPFLALFEVDLIEKNLTFLEESLVDGSHWEPNWNWGDQYKETWPKARAEWMGKLTSDHLMLLKQFG